MCSALPLTVQWTMNQHYPGWWLGAKQATSHYLTQFTYAHTCTYMHTQIRGRVNTHTHLLHQTSICYGTCHQVFIIDHLISNIMIMIIMMIIIMIIIIMIIMLMTMMMILLLLLLLLIIIIIIIIIIIFIAGFQNPLKIYKGSHI